ncbi:protein of unknown function [Alcaligenes faecalis subsp. faecalis]|nr:protein of unknown function [Alcaligenes faecalis subsp. faecalis]
MQSPAFAKSDGADSVVVRCYPVLALVAGGGGGGGGGFAWQEVQGAELGRLVRRLMVQASAGHKKRRADSAVFFYTCR